MLKSRNIVILMLILLLTVFSSLALPGCESDETGKSEPGESENKDSESDSTSDGNQESKEKILAIGKKSENKKMEEVAVTKVTTTQSLTSPEATALLKTGAPGESEESAAAPEPGNEFLLVTFTFKGKEDKTRIFPNEVTLTDADGKEIEKTETSGHGGLYNMDMIDKGKESSVTAVFEVPKDAEGLALTYQPFGDKVIKYKVR